MLTELIKEVEEKLRQIVREEVRLALAESKISSAKIDSSSSVEKEKAITNRNFPTLLLARDVAEILGVSIQRVYELTRARKANGFPVVILGLRQYRFNKDAILAWVERENQ